MNIPPKPPDPPDAIGLSQPMFTAENLPSSLSAPDNNRKHKLPLTPPNNVASLDKRTRGTGDIDTSVSLQTLYTHPSFSETRTYTQDDHGPFIVHVTKTDSDPTTGSNIRPIKFGQLLHHNNVRGIVKDGVKGLSRRKICVEFKTADDANQFVACQFMKNHKYAAIIPTYNITRMGLVRGVPVDWSLDEFVESLEIPEGYGIVLKARRLNRKNIVNGNTNWVPTQTVVLTLSGQKLPNRIYSFHTSMVVETYQLPTIQCHNCCRFGHVKAQCRSEPRCYRCAQKHTGESCKVEEEKATCLLCSGGHFATDRNCPEHIRQRRIKQLMSQDGISYMEASALTPKSRRPYNDVAKEVRTSFLASMSPSQSPYKPVSPTQVSNSYKKTVTLNPRSRPTLPQGYDRQAHQAIISDIPSIMPNGCALQNQTPSSINDNDQLIETCLSMITVILSKFNDSLPSNVASKLNALFNALPKSVISPQEKPDDDGHSVSSMEH